jgi:uncharacterized protein (UPF0333 family)
VKKLFGFLIGLILIAIMGAMLFFAGNVYDAANARHIEPFIIQPNNLSTDRIGKPIAIEQLSEKFIRERLIRKFVHEYFYVMPDDENIARRTRSDSVMAAMSAPDVFREWTINMAEDITEMASKKMMRTVAIADEIIQVGDYWEIYYELTTWDTPNNMDILPVVDTGTMYLRVAFEPGVRETRGGSNFDIRRYLNNGGDPAAIFKFRVDEVK